MNNDDFMSELFRRSDLIKIASRYVHLTKKGNTYWGCCPFHHEKTPSFTISEDKGLYHCFGCKASGNVINFVSEIESVSRGEAVQILAKEAGLEIPQRSGNTRDYAAESAKRERLYNLMRDAARHYHENLNAPQGKIARDYLEKRGVSKELITRFGLGYSISGNEMVAYLKGKGYKPSEMKEAGLAEQRADEYYDVFYGRLIFPIINNRGEVVSFGGRVFEAKPDFAKYRNGTQTLIFDKSHNIYAVNLLKKRKQRAGINYIVVTEGYMDVIALHKAGFDTAVASMGTALTTQQAKLLKNYCDKIYISYDGDGAGEKGTLRGLDILAETGLNVKVVELPEGPDPDDIIREGGREAYQKLLDEAVTLTQFKINVLKKKYDLTKVDERAKFAVESAKIIKALKNPVEQEEYLRKVSEITGYTMEALLKQTDISVIPEQTAAAPPAQKSETPVMDQYLKFVLASILSGQPYVSYDLDIYPYLQDSLSRRIYEHGLKCFKSDEKLGLGEFYELTPESDRPMLDELTNHTFLAGDDEKKYADCVKNYAINSLNARRKEVAKEFDSTHDAALVKEMMELDRKINALKSGDRDD